MSVSDQINSLIAEAKAFTPANKEELETYRLRFLGKKGVLTDLFAKMKEVAAEDRKAYGQMVNELKVAAEEKIAVFREQFEAGEAQSGPALDLSLPADPQEIGSHHPLSIVRRQIINIFSRIGFNVSDGPEIEDDWHNFSARTPGARYAGHLLHRPRCQSGLLQRILGIAHPYLLNSGSGNGETATTNSHDLSGTCVPQRSHLCPRPLLLPPGRRILH